MSKTLKVVQEADEPIAAEIIAAAIIKISDGFSRMTHAGLNRRAIRVLLASSTRVNQVEIDKVLDGIEMLKRDFCLPPKKPGPAKR